MELRIRVCNKTFLLFLQHVQSLFFVRVKNNTTSFHWLFTRITVLLHKKSIQFAVLVVKAALLLLVVGSTVTFLNGGRSSLALIRAEICSCCLIDAVWYEVRLSMFLCPLSWETWIGWTLLFNKVEMDVLRAEWFATFDRLQVLQAKYGKHLIKTYRESSFLVGDDSTRGCF